MAESPLPPGATVSIPLEDLARLFQELRRRGFTLIGPRVLDGELILTELASPSDLPGGFTNTTAPGAFSLIPTDSPDLFGVIGGQPSWKQFFYPPRRTLWHAQRESESWEVVLSPPATPAYACIGVRACDLAAIQVHDRVFLQGDHIDPDYQARRRAAFIVAVHCTRAAPTCFCASVGSGPRARQGFDLALTEIVSPKAHYFLVDVGSEAGAAVLGALDARRATPEELAAGVRLTARAAAPQERSLPTAGLPEALLRSYTHPRWDEVADRCLSCGNCTMVCPTCFCHTVEDATDPTGNLAERRRRWDSCFTTEFSYIHGGAIRTSVKSRYRQWLTHKLAHWVEQFGCLGCVGCGRCITWCPVGIDLTVEAQALRAGQTKE